MNGLLRPRSSLKNGTLSRGGAVRDTATFIDSPDTEMSGLVLDRGEHDG